MTSDSNVDLELLKSGVPALPAQGSSLGNGQLASGCNRSPKVVVKNLTKRFGELVVLDNISFSVGKGEFLCIVGPTGCGKTTFLNCLSKLIPTSQAIFLSTVRSLTPGNTMSRLCSRNPLPCRGERWQRISRSGWNSNTSRRTSSRNG